MLLDCIGQTKPSWLSEPEQQHRSFRIQPRDRWLFQSNLPLTSSAGSGTIQLLEAGKHVESLLLYRQISDTEKLAVSSRNQFEKILFGESLGIAESSDSNTTFDRASIWLHNCLDNHTSCRPKYASFMPSRILQLYQTPQDMVSLIESSALIAPAPYVALSYCWGPDTAGVLKTVKSNKASHLQGIPVKSLPKTIQDAVTVCRKLNVRYLWVDALCILQDDIDDWNKEAAQMAVIYANSHFTLVAREPKSCKQGFLGSQRFGSPDWQRALAVTVPESLGGSNGQILVRDGHLESYALKSLDSRAWCLQESALTKRRLVFDDCELSWQCMEKAMCECGHLDEDVDGDSSYLKTTRDSIQKPEGDTMYFQLHREWMDLVEQYSQRSLTKSGDKLVAISGLAKLFQENLTRTAHLSADTHIIALFREELVRPDMVMGVIRRSYHVSALGNGGEQLDRYQ
ncbi:hypothetical protein QQX98_010873 [Neonectria punicea]|uniref:Heterokaryon incompatibility domain-containing protein n=1 Tax=Neonectria punicea TaxID=979145 RepID=A0ABR1GNK8_9HYPO